MHSYRYAKFDTTEVGVAGDVDLEAAIARLDAALLGDAVEAAVNVALRCVDAAAHVAVAHADAAAEALLLAAVGAAVLQALDVEVAANIGLDLVRRYHGALQGGVFIRK